MEKDEEKRVREKGGGVRREGREDRLRQHVKTRASVFPPGDFGEFSHGRYYALFLSSPLRLLASAFLFLSLSLLFSSRGSVSAFHAELVYFRARQREEEEEQGARV